MTRAASRGRFRQRLLVLFLLAMLIPYARQVVSSPTLGQDFRAFFAAATVVAHQGDPYSWPTLGATEYRLYDASGGIKPGDATYYEFLAYPEGPWLAFALAPLTSLPWRVAYALFAALLGLIPLAAAFGTFTRLGWAPRPGPPSSPRWASSISSWGRSRSSSLAPLSPPGCSRLADDPGWPGPCWRSSG